MLSAARRDDWNVAAVGEDTVILVGTDHRRVRLRGRVPQGRLRAVMEAVAVATSVDERPARRRRQDLTGFS